MGRVGNLPGRHLVHLLVTPARHLLTHKRSQQLQYCHLLDRLGAALKHLQITMKVHLHSAHSQQHDDLRLQGLAVAIEHEQMQTLLTFVDDAAATETARGAAVLDEPKLAGGADTAPQGKSACSATQCTAPDLHNNRFCFGLQLVPQKRWMSLLRA